MGNEEMAARKEEAAKGEDVAAEGPALPRGQTALAAASRLAWWSRAL
jgi:hypothetical protein